MSKSFFDLAGGDYWTDPWKNLQKIAWDSMTKGTPQFVIDAPEFVPLDEYKTVPLLAYQSGDTADLSKSPFEDLAVVALMDLTENRLIAQSVPKGDAPEPSGPVSPGFAALEYKVELTELVNIPWQASSYIATVLMREKVSNRATIKLGRAANAFDDPEVLKFVEARRAKRPPRLLSPDALSPMIRHGSVQGSLPVPDKAGLAMRIERVMVALPGKPAWLEIGFRLPVSKTDVLPPPEAPVEEGKPVETARAVVSLLILSSEASVPRVFPFVVPSFEKVEGEPDVPVAQGVFSVDLAQLANLANEPQTYFIYAFSGELMSGPAVVAFVDPRLLPFEESPQ